MIDTIVRSFLGGFGGQMLDFYQANSLWINGALLVYALLVILSRRAYNRILAALSGELVENNPKQYLNRSLHAVQKTLERSTLPWQNALQSAAFPFITPTGKLWLYLKSRKNAEKLMLPSALAGRIVSISKAREQINASPEDTP